MGFVAGVGKTIIIQYYSQKREKQSLDNDLHGLLLCPLLLSATSSSVLPTPILILTVLEHSSPLLLTKDISVLGVEAARNR